MIKIVIALTLMFNFAFAELNNVKYNKTLHYKQEDPAVKYVRNMITTKEVRNLVGMKLDPLTTITNVYQDYTDRKNILYEYTIDTNKAKNIKESQYNQYAIFFWEQNLPNICAIKELQEAMKIGVGFRYIYLDSNRKTVADMTIRKTDCDKLKK